MRKGSGVDVGDTVGLSIVPDSIPRVPKSTDMPEMLRLALDSDTRAKAAFERLTPSRKKEILAYLNHLKKEESLKRNIEKVIASMTPGHDA